MKMIISSSFNYLDLTKCNIAMLEGHTELEKGNNMEQHLGGVIKVWQRSEGDKINILHIIEIKLQKSHYFYGKLWTG